MTPSPTARPPWWDDDCLRREQQALDHLLARRDRLKDLRTKAQVMRVADAEHECVHGNIRTHPNKPDPCGCWPDEVLKALWFQVEDYPPDVA